MTVSEMLAECYRRLNYQTSPAAAVTTRLIGYLNDVETELLSIPGLSSMLESLITFASVADQAVYGLPPSVARVLSVRDTANQWRLREIPASEYWSLIPDQTSETGTPVAYARLGLRSVMLDPSDASELFLISTSVSDTQVAFYEGVQTGGALFSGQVTLTGVTGVSLSSALTGIVQLTDLYLVSAATGTVTLREDSGAGTTLSTIYPGTIRSLYQRIALVPTPQEALTYAVDYERDRVTLQNGTDQSALPPRFHRVLPVGALVREYELLGDRTRYQMLFQDYARSIGLLNAYVSSPPDTVVVPGGSRGRVPSVLGPWTPSPPYGSN